MTNAHFRILVVEDDALLSELLCEHLTGFGHDVCATIRTEQEAIAAAALYAPDLMIVDMHIQAGSGVAVMETVLREGPMPHIFMTAGSDRAIPADAIVLYKPFSSNDLLEAIRRVAQTP